MVKEKLDLALGELQTVEARITDLQANLGSMQRRKLELESNIDLCSVKLHRAQSLLGGLGGEKVRWQAIADEMGLRYAHLIGDVLVSSGIIAYLGPFTVDLRAQCIHAWVQACKDLGIPSSEDFSFQSPSFLTAAVWVWYSLPSACVNELPPDSGLGLIVE